MACSICGLNSCSCGDDVLILPVGPAGPKGEKGADGTDGADGATGEKGATGAMGPTTVSKLVKFVDNSGSHYIEASELALAGMLRDVYLVGVGSTTAEVCDFIIEVWWFNSSIYRWQNAINKGYVTDIQVSAGGKILVTTTQDGRYRICVIG